MESCSNWLCLIQRQYLTQVRLSRLHLTLNLGISECPKYFRFHYVLVLYGHLRPSIKVNSLIAYDNGADRSKTNSLGRRGCVGITDSQIRLK